MISIRDAAGIGAVGGVHSGRESPKIARTQERKAWMRKVPSTRSRVERVTVTSPAAERYVSTESAPARRKAANDAPRLGRHREY